MKSHLDTFNFMDRGEKRLKYLLKHFDEIHNEYCARYRSDSKAWKEEERLKNRNKRIIKKVLKNKSYAVLYRDHFNNMIRQICRYIITGRYEYRIEDI